MRRHLGPLKILIPTTFTGLSIYFAVRAIGSPIDRITTDAAWFICLSVLLDKLDGTSARLLGAQSHFGLELDSVADFLAFGLAPAVMFYRLNAADPYSPHGLELAMGLVALFYAVATGARLYRFNKEAGGRQSKSFSGMPSTLSGAIFASFVLACGQTAGSSGRLALPVLMLVLGVAMNAPYRTRKVTIPKRKLLLVGQSIWIAFLYVAVLTRQFPEVVFASAVAALAISIQRGVEADAGDAAGDNGPRLRML